MNDILAEKDWHTLLSSSSVEENWSTFKNLLTNLTIDNKRLILDWKLLSATVTIRVSRPQQDSDGRLQK